MIIKKNNIINKIFFNTKYEILIYKFIFKKNLNLLNLSNFILYKSLNLKKL